MCIGASQLNGHFLRPRKSRTPVLGRSNRYGTADGLVGRGNANGDQSSGVEGNLSLCLGPFLVRYVSLPCSELHSNTNICSLHAFHCQQGEIGVLQPPKVPLPTNTPTGPSQVSHHSPMFLSFCQLWVLVHEVLGRYFGKGPVLSTIRFDRDFVRAMLARLLAFGDQLPLQLARGSEATHGALILQ